MDGARARAAGVRALSTAELKRDKFRFVTPIHGPRSRPRESGDPYAVSQISRLAQVAFETRRLWVPAFASRSRGRQRFDSGRIALTPPLLPSLPRSTSSLSPRASSPAPASKTCPCNSLALSQYLPAGPRR